MELIKAIKTRRSIRKYKDKKVPVGLLKKVIESARWAPSVHNIQPWKCIVPSQQTKKNIINALKKRHGKEPLIVRMTMRKSIEIIEAAPEIILVYNNCMLSKKVIKGGRLYYQNSLSWETQSVACAIQNMLLTAHALRLGMTWLGIPVFRENDINTVIETTERLVAILSLGYPDEKPSPLPKKSFLKTADIKSRV